MPDTLESALDDMFAPPSLPSQIDDLFAEPERPVNGPDLAATADGLEQAATPAPPILSPESQGAISDGFRIDPFVADVQESMWLHKATGHNYQLDHAQTRRVEETAAGLTFRSFQQFGLMDAEGRLSPHVSKDDVKRLIGIYRHTLVPLLSGLSDKERGDVATMAMRALTDRLFNGFVAASEEAKANGDADQAQDFAERAGLARELGSRADEPRIRKAFLHFSAESMRQVRDTLPEASDDAILLDATSAQIGDGSALKTAYHAERAKTPLGRQSVFDDMQRLLYEAPSVLKDKFVPDRLISDATRGAVTRLRAERLDLADGQTDAVTLQSSAFFADPKFTQKLMDAASLSRAQTLGGRQLFQKMPDEDMAKVRGRVEENMNWALNKLAQTTLGPWASMNRTEIAGFDTDDGWLEEGKTAAVDLADRGLQILGSLLRSGGAVGEALVGLGETAVGAVATPIAQQLKPGMTAPEARDMAASLVANSHLAVASKQITERLEAVDKEIAALDGENDPTYDDRLAALTDEKAYLKLALFNPSGNRFSAIAVIAAGAGENIDPVLDRLRDTGFTPRIFASALQHSVRAQLDAVPGFTQKDLEKSNARVARLIRGGTFQDVHGLKWIADTSHAVAENAVTRVLSEGRETIEFFVDDPEMAGNIAALFMLAPPAVGGVVKAIPGRSAFLSRAGRLMRDAVAVDGFAAEQVRELILKAADKPGADGFRKVFRGAMSYLEQIIEEHKPNVVRAAAGGMDPETAAHISKLAFRFEKFIRRLGPDTMTDLLTSLGVDKHELMDLRKSGFRDIVYRFGKRLFDRFEVPAVVKRRTEEIAGRLERAVEQGASPVMFGDLPISADILALGGNRARRALLKVTNKYLAGAPPLVQGFMRRLSAISEIDGRYMRELVEYTQNKQIPILAQRALVAERLGDLDSFIDASSRTQRQHHRELMMDSAASDIDLRMDRSEVEANVGSLRAQREALDADIAEANKLLLEAQESKNMEIAQRALAAKARAGEGLADVNKGLSRANEILSALDSRDALERGLEARMASRNAVRRRGWDAGVDITGSRWFRDEVSPEEVIAWSALRHGLDEVMHVLGEKGARQLVEVMKRDPEDARLAKTADKLKRTLAAEYLHSPGLRDTIVLDQGTGRALTPRQWRREKQTLSQLDPEELELAAARFTELSGVRNTVRRLREHAEAERAAGATAEPSKLVKKMAVRAQDLNGLPIEMLAEEVANFKHEILGNAAVWQHRVAYFEREYNKMLPRQQQLVNTALLEFRKSGKISNLAELRKQVPWIARTWPESDDMAAQAALNMSASLLNDLVDIHAASTGKGSRFAAMREYLDQPYAPQRYAGPVLDDLLKQAGINIPAPRAEGKVKLLDVNKSFLEPQRDIGRFKLLVTPKGGAPIVKTFDNKREARQWVEEAYGIRKSEKKGDDLTGVTAMGDRFNILKPLDPQRAKDLGLLAPMEGLTLRLKDLAESNATQQFFNMLNRPGWTFTVDEWDQFTNTTTGKLAQKRGDYVQLPKGAAILGDLDGKYVHKRVFSWIEDFGERYTAIQALADSLKTMSQSTTGLMSLLNNAGRTSRTMTGIMKSLVVANQLMRNPRAIATNVLGDRIHHASAAVGTAFIWSRAGVHATARAFQDLWSFIMKGEMPGNPDFHEAVDRGIFDDFGVIGDVDDRLRQEMNKMLFEKKEHLDPEFQALFRAEMPDDDPFYKVFYRALGADIEEADADPLLRKVEDLERAATSESLTAHERIQAKHRLVKLRALLARERPGAVGGKMAKGLSRMWLWMLGRPGGSFRDKPQWAARFYNIVNNVTRMGAYYYARNKLEWSPEYTSRRINMFMQTFHRVPRAIRAFSKWPIANPIISYPYEAVRTYSNMILHELPTVAALNLGIPAFNMVESMRQGDDPFEIARTYGANDPSGWIKWATTVHVGNGDSTYSTFQMPQLSALTLLRMRADPTYAHMIAEDEGETGVMGVLNASLHTIAGNFFGNPLTKAMSGILGNRDAATGKPASDRAEAIMGHGAELLRTSIPAYAPFVGNQAHQFSEGMDRPPEQLTGRRITDAQRAFQVLTGARLRGVELPPIVGQLMAFWAGRDPRDMAPVTNDPGFSKADVFKQALILAKRTPLLNGGSPTPGMADRERDIAFEKARMSVFYEMHGDKKGAERLLREGLAEEKKKREDQSELAKERFGVGSEGDMSSREVRLQERALRTFDFDATFREAPVAVQAGTISALSLFPSFVDDNDLRGLLVEAMTRTRNNTLELRTRAEEDGIAISIDILKEWEQAHSDREVAPLVSAWRVLLEQQLVIAKSKLLRQLLNNEMRLEAYLDVRDAKKQ